MKLTVREIADIVSGVIVGKEDAVITGVSGIKEAKSGEITFIANNKYRPLLKSTQASAVFVPRDISNTVDASLIQVTTLPWRLQK